ncbi:MAG TPA: CHRD domain-containing protein [Trichocoleus sp.]
MKPKFSSTKCMLGLFVVLSGIALPQIARAGHTNRVLSTELTGRAEVASNARNNRMVGDPNGMGSAYVFGVDGDPTTLCYVLKVSDIQLVPVGEGIAAHIHEGAADENGPVVAALAGPEDGNAGDCLTEGEEGKFPTGEAGIVQRILTNPEKFYINVHNPEFPNGAIRGQLMGMD